VPGNPRPSFRRFVIRQKTSRAIASRRPPVGGDDDARVWIPKKRRNPAKKWVRIDDSRLETNETERATRPSFVRSSASRVRLTRPSPSSSVVIVFAFVFTSSVLLSRVERFDSILLHSTFACVTRDRPRVGNATTPGFC
jgi:hypothetical protein